MKFIDFLNEEPTLEPQFQKEFTSIGKNVKYKERYKNIFGDKDRIFLPYSGSKFNNKYVKYGDNSEYVLDMIEDLDLDFDYRKLKNDKYFEKYLPKDTISVDIDSIDTLEFNSKNRNVKISVELSYKNKHIKDGSMGFNITIPYKELIELSSLESKTKQTMLNILNVSERLLDSKNNGKEMQIVISRNPCDIGSMSTGTHWKSCMNLYDGSYNKFTRADVEHGTLIAYLILKGDKNIELPIGRVLIKPYKESGKNPKTYLSISDRVYGYFPNKAKKVLKKFIDEKQKDIKGVFNFNTKLYNDDDNNFIINDFIYSLGFKVGDRAIFNLGDMKFAGKIVRDEKNKYIVVDFDKKWYNKLKYHFKYIKDNMYRIDYQDNYNFIKKVMKKESKNEI